MSSFISSIGTAVPKNRLSQKDIREFMIRHLGSSEEIRRNIELIYRASGIGHRHSVISDFGREIQDYSFFPPTLELEPFPSVASRMALYQNEAIKLAKEAVLNAVSRETLKDVTHLITVSCTGMYAPGIDIELIEELGLRTDIQRTSINFMGCYAAFNALKIANSLVSSAPNSKVLIVAVELCSIHLLKNTSEDSILSNALFGDGAAAVLIESNPTSKALELKGFYADIDTSGKDAMGWYIDDFGFDMKLTSEVPEVIKKGIAKLTQKLLNQLELSASEIDHFAIHPGGKKILKVIEEELNLTAEHNKIAYDVLYNYGNMSSPTVLFVIKELMNQLTSEQNGDHILSFAFGPGLTMESMLLKVVHS